MPGIARYHLLSSRAGSSPSGRHKRAVIILVSTIASMVRRDAVAFFRLSLLKLYGVGALGLYRTSSTPRQQTALAQLDDNKPIAQKSAQSFKNVD